MANKKKNTQNKPRNNFKKEEVKKEENFLDEKPKKEWKDTIFYKVTNVILWIVLFVWMAICLVDFYQTHQEKEPMFCLKKEVTKYDDGNYQSGKIRSSCGSSGYGGYSYDSVIANKKNCAFTIIEFEL